MQYGLLLVNSSGITQIDQDYSNFQVYQTGTLSGDPSYTGTVIPDSWFSDGFGIFVRPPNTSVQFCLGGDGYGGTGTHLWSSSVATFQYMLIKPATAFSSVQQYGLNIYKSNGTLAFASEHTVAKAIAALAFPGAASPGTYDYTLPVTTELKYVDLARGARTRVNFMGSPLELPLIQMQLLSETSLRIITSASNVPAAPFIFTGI